MSKKLLLKYIIADIIFALGILLLISGLLFKFYPLTEEVPGDSHSFLPAEVNLNYPEIIPALSDNTFSNKRADHIQVDRIEVNIPPGVSTLEVADILLEKNLTEGTEFLKMVKLFNLERKIKAGKYTFIGNIDTVDILAKLLAKGGD